MEVYCINDNPKDHQVYIVKLGTKKLLFGGGLDMDKLSHFLPNFYDKSNNEIPEKQEQSRKYQKISEEQEKQIKKQEEESSMEAENPLIGRVGEDTYFKGRIKFDLTIYENLDWEEIDYVVVSNLDEIYGLPYICQRTKFNGSVLTTLPIVQIGEGFCNELRKSSEVRTKLINLSINEQQQQQQQQVDYFLESEFYEQFEENGILIERWQEIYTEDEITQTFESIVPLNHNQLLEIDKDTEIEPVNSGYSIGSCNWIIHLKDQHIYILSGSSISAYRHCPKLDITKLQQCNTILCTNWIASDDPKKNYESHLSEFLSAIIKFLKNPDGGNILIPIKNALILLDLLDIFQHKICDFNRFNVISSSCEALLAYSNINIDYLNQILRSKIFVNQPTEPIAFQTMNKNSKLFWFEDLDEFQKHNTKLSSHFLDDHTPSLYFIYDSTMRLGYSSKFYQILNQYYPQSLLLFTDSTLNQEQAFKCFKTNNKLKYKICPLNPALTTQELIKIIQGTTQPQKWYVPYTLQHEFHKAQISFYQKEFQYYMKNQKFEIKFKIKNITELTELHSKIESNIKLKSIAKGLKVAPVTLIQTGSSLFSQSDFIKINERSQGKYLEKQICLRNRCNDLEKFCTDVCLILSEKKYDLKKIEKIVHAHKTQGFRIQFLDSAKDKQYILVEINSIKIFALSADKYKVISKLIQEVLLPKFT